jgi:hypothetical protein
MISMKKQQTINQEDGMKKVRIIFLAVLCMLFCLSLSQSGLGQDAAALEVVDSAICAGVENLTCVEPSEEFSGGVEKLYCFTRINGAQGDIEITHVWYFGDIERARVSLAVRSSSYRTYSSKKIQIYELGPWHVDVLGPDGKVLKTISFTMVE